MNDRVAKLTEIDSRIAQTREIIRQLMDRSSSASGAAAEEAIASQLEEAETHLQALLTLRDDLGKNEDEGSKTPT